MRKYLFASVAIAMSLGLAEVAAAQMGSIPLAVEIRGGFPIPLGDFQEQYNAETGVGFGANAQLQLIPALAVYAGWERNTFSVDDQARIAPGSELIDEGFSFGGQFTVPMAAMGLSPWLRAGAVYNQFRREGGTLTADFESDRKIGFEVGGGIAIPLGNVISITPGVRYRSYSPELGGQNRIGDDVDVSYLAADVAMKFHF